MRPTTIIKQNFWTAIKDYLLISLGVLFYTGGWTFFLMPKNLVGGGVTGIGVILEYATGFPVSYTYLILNVLLLIVSFFILGKGFGAKTIYAILLTTLCFRFMGQIPGVQEFAAKLTGDSLIAVLMGGIMSGIGIGMSMSVGGSTGGTDIIALIYTKFRNVSPGKVIFALDVVIICSSLLVPSYQVVDGVETLVDWPDKVLAVVFGFLLVVITSTVLDMYLSGSKQSVQLFILSKKSEEIADAITSELHRGVTMLDGMGWYTKEPTKVLMVITRKTDLNIMLRYIKALDPHAFLSVSSVNGVFGKGFDAIKGESKVSKK